MSTRGWLGLLAVCLASVANAAGLPIASELSALSENIGPERAELAKVDALHFAHQPTSLL